MFGCVLIWCDSLCYFFVFVDMMLDKIFGLGGCYLVDCIYLYCDLVL